MVYHLYFLKVLILLLLCLISFLKNNNIVIKVTIPCCTFDPTCLTIDQAINLRNNCVKNRLNFKFRFERHVSIAYPTKPFIYENNQDITDILLANIFIYLSTFFGY